MLCSQPILVLLYFLLFYYGALVYSNQLMIYLPLLVLSLINLPLLIKEKEENIIKSYMVVSLSSMIVFCLCYLILDVWGVELLKLILLFYSLVAIIMCCYIKEYWGSMVVYFIVPLYLGYSSLIKYDSKFSDSVFIVFALFTLIHILVVKKYNISKELICDFLLKILFVVSMFFLVFFAFDYREFMFVNDYT